ncbi:hypothetical protein D8674_034665 [Pyrus ussuriensis x Pyrus communis]|uniref:Uncharacterized protein n=1 Tax=Pyrus ussuriensis x Pyrus communis TaxID=2448454 RepID=A0A5N5GA74_9ROSA|nr:hypothetical protein D8674_034665 [Pyrus ussuriensis x Pyrus communis]
MPNRPGPQMGMDQVRRGVRLGSCAGGYTDASTKGWDPVCCRRRDTKAQRAGMWTRVKPGLNGLRFRLKKILALLAGVEVSAAAFGGHVLGQFWSG